MDIRLQQSLDDEKVEALLDLTFGKDRFAKAAYGLRKNVNAMPELSFVIYDGDKLIASLRFWPVMIKTAPTLLLGPIAVHPDLQGFGYGINLMKYGLEAAEALGHSRIILVGDEEYYSKVGFNRALAARLWIKGQTDPSRILACALKADAFDKIKGEVQNIRNLKEKNIFFQKYL